MKIDKEAIRTGVPLIDTQHEHYIDLVEELFGLCEQEAVEQSAVSEGLERVFVYAVEHFDAEESLMVSFNYPDYENHKAQHDEFKGQIDRLMAVNEDASRSDDLVIQLTKWLIEWFYSQTLVHDKKLAEFIKDR